MNIKGKLAERLRSEFGLNVSADDFYRTYAGKHMRAAGAFVWMFISKESPIIIGGCEPASKYCVKKNKLVMGELERGEIEIYVYAPDDFGYEQI